MCDEMFMVNGTDAITCTASGQWKPYGYHNTCVVTGMNIFKYFAEEPYPFFNFLSKLVTHLE